MQPPLVTKKSVEGETLARLLKGLETTHQTPVAGESPRKTGYWRTELWNTIEAVDPPQTARRSVPKVVSRFPGRGPIRRGASRHDLGVSF